MKTVVVRPSGRGTVETIFCVQEMYIKYEDADQ